MEKIVTGKYVELVFDLFRINEDGSETLVHQVTKDEPECILYGVTQGLVVPLEKALNGLQPGDTYDVTAKSEEAFGAINDDQIVELDREMFMVDGKFDKARVKPGAVLPMVTEDGYQIVGIVKEVNDAKVVMDFNHPLAGYDVRISGSVLVVRDATEEDLKPKGCGCGCQGGCGDGGCQSDGGDCGCGDGGCQSDGGDCGCGGGCGNGCGCN
jgi:FKBP-type peptidyl-prolyl cis-trans isomerase SlyD